MCVCHMLYWFSLIYTSCITAIWCMYRLLSERSHAETFVACSCHKLVRHCEICPAAAWNGCAGGKLCGSFTTIQHELFSVVCQGGVQSSASSQWHCGFDSCAIVWDQKLWNWEAWKLPQSIEAPADVSAQGGTVPVVDPQVPRFFWDVNLD